MGYSQECHKIRSEFTKEDTEIQSLVGQINYERNTGRREMETLKR